MRTIAKTAPALLSEILPVGGFHAPAFHAKKVSGSDRRETKEHGML